jgi:hypothetical protein
MTEDNPVYGACILPAFQELFREAGREGGGEGGVVVELEGWEVKQEKYPPSAEWARFDGKREGGREGGRGGGREGREGGSDQYFVLSSWQLRFIPGSSLSRENLPPSPALDDPGFLIPGAMASAYDGDSWIEKMKEVVR